MAETEEGEGSTSKEYHMRRNKKKIKLENEKKPIKLADDLIFLILARLPAKSLIRFSSVCKSWNVLVKKDSFFASQHVKAQSKPAIAALISNDEPYEKEFTLNYGYGSELPTVFSSMPDLKVDFMTNSCDGLVGIYNRERFWLVNPSIKKIAELPRGSPHRDITEWPLETHIPVAAIGCESSTGDYKVVRIFHRGNNNIGSEMFSLTSGTWKTVNDPPNLPYCKFYLPVVANDFIYWTVLPKITTLIDITVSPGISVCFNMREETFSIIQHPMGNHRRLNSRLVNLGGYVCAADEALAGRLTIWHLKDTLKSEWVKLYEIDIRKYHSAVPLTMDCGRIVLQSSGWMHYYDPRTLSFVKHEQNDKCGFFTPCFESVVWPYYDTINDSIHEVNYNADTEEAIGSIVGVSSSGDGCVKNAKEVRRSTRTKKPPAALRDFEWKKV